MKRGYFGIGVYQPKTEANIGTLWRSAHCFGANFIFVVGRRYRKQPSDTTNALLHVPLFEFPTLEDMEVHKPVNCPTICIEISSKARDLKTIIHPERAIYILGAEDYGLPEEFLRGRQVIQVEGAKYCLNVAVAGSIVMWDRYVKSL